MKVFVITPITTGIYKDDTEMFCEGLEKYFCHEVVRGRLYIKNNDILVKDNFDLEKEIKGCDVIWAPYEPLIPIGIYLKEEHKIPLLGHFEVVPPGRVNLDNINLHHLVSTNPLGKNEHYEEYRNYAHGFLRCDVKTVIGQEEKYKIEKLLGKKIQDKTYIKPYPVDNEYLESFKINNCKEKNQIVCISSLVPHKKVHHLIKAFSLIKNQTKLIIIGQGKIESELKEYAKRLKLNIDFVGLISDEEKFKIIQESMFLVHPWACLPVGEAAFFKKASINYDEAILRDRLNDMPYYAEANNIMDLAQCIDNFIINTKLRKEWGEKAHKMLINGETETYLLRKACSKINDLLILTNKVKV